MPYVVEGGKTVNLDWYLNVEHTVNCNYRHSTNWNEFVFLAVSARDKRIEITNKLSEMSHSYSSYNTYTVCSYSDLAHALNASIRKIKESW